MNSGRPKGLASLGKEDNCVFRSYPQCSRPIAVNRTRSSPGRVPLVPNLLPPVAIKSHQAIFPTSPDRTAFIFSQGIDVAAGSAVGHSIVHSMAVPQKTNCT